jgi:thiosulfate/3-mercaptopyruvate sulfurtransferase
MHRATSALFVLILLLVALAHADDKEYPRPELAEPAALVREGSAIIVLDARERHKHDAGHVPGALWVDHAAWARAFVEGITADSKVVVYDDNRSREAARIWWLLRYWGVEHVRVLNGGWIGWKAGGHAIEKTQNTPKTMVFIAKPLNGRLTTKGQILESLKEATLQIVDTRSEKEFCGEEKLKNRRGGAVPGSKHLEWSELLDEKSHRFKSPSEMRKLFEGADVSLDRPSATFCQTGGRASVMAFGMELMGARAVGNYYASWAEWGNAEDTPVVKPTPKKR